MNWSPGDLENCIHATLVGHTISRIDDRYSTLFITFIVPCASLLFFLFFRISTYLEGTVTVWQVLAELYCALVVQRADSEPKKHESEVDRSYIELFLCTRQQILHLVLKTVSELFANLYTANALYPFYYCILERV